MGYLPRPTFLGALPTLTGLVTYRTGEPVLERFTGQCLTEPECLRQIETGILSGDSGPSPTYRPIRCAPSRIAGCWETIVERLDQVGGAAGWEIAVPNLIPTAGGYLAGLAALEGDLSQLVSGQVTTVYGEWVGNPPSNLVLGGTWRFRVLGYGQAPADPFQATAPGQTPPPPAAPSTGAATTEEELAPLRLETIAAQEGLPALADVAADLRAGEITLDEATAAYQTIQAEAAAEGEAEETATTGPRFTLSGKTTALLLTGAAVLFLGWGRDRRGRGTQRWGD